MNQPDDPQTDETFRSRAQSAQPGLLSELAEFMVHNKRWWLVPMIVVLLVLGLMIVVTNTAIVPGIYMLF